MEVVFFMSAEQSLTLSVPEAANLLGIGKTLMWSVVQSGRIPTLKIGARVLIPRAVIESMVARAAAGGSVQLSLR
jgi:excisionase family DNA binding protein